MKLEKNVSHVIINVINVPPMITVKNVLISTDP